MREELRERQTVRHTREDTDAQATLPPAQFLAMILRRMHARAPTRRLSLSSLF